MSTVSPGTGRAATGAIGAAGSPASSQVVSAGRMSVATPPGGAVAAATASAASRATCSGEFVSRIHVEKLRAIVSMSDVQRRVEPTVIRRVVADDVHHRRAGTTRVVQVGEPVPEAGTEVQQRRGRAFGHAAVAVGRAGRDALEQARALRASRGRRRAPPRTASRRFPDWRSRRRRPRRRAYGSGRAHRSRFHLGISRKACRD